jgi:hypothetical protein
MRYPARLSHLATRQVVVARLMPTFAQAHDLDDEEAVARLEAALTPALMERLLGATWQALLGSTKRLDESALLEKVAGTIADRPQRPGRKAPPTPAWSAFMLVLDLEAGTASDMARRVLESPEGQKKAEEGLAEVGRFLAAELTRG